MKGYLKYYEPYDENEYHYSGGWAVCTTKEWEVNMQTFELSDDSIEWVINNNPPKLTEINFDVIPTCKYDEEKQKGYHRFVAKIHRSPEFKSKIFMIDIDGTICEDIKNEESHLYPTAKVIQGSLEQINKWFEEGHTITFFTAREEKDRVVTLKWLWENGFKFHQLVMDKPRIKDGQEYVWIDNRKVRAVTYMGTWSDLVEVNVKIQTFS
jgi:hypothetical protein